MAKIAVELEKALARRALDGGAGRTTTRWLAWGEGWRVGDVICTSGPDDRPFEERHASIAIALVTAGTFQYRSAEGRELMTPGSLMLGNAGQSFKCGHEHGLGDRCLSFHYDPDYFEGLAADAAGGSRTRPSRGGRPSFRPLRLAGGFTPGTGSVSPAATARVTRAVRRIERDPGDRLSLSELAREARLSPCHLLRSFQRTTGMTPHQFVL